MKNVFKNAGYSVAGCALLLSVYSCGNNSGSTATSDSTSMSTATTATDKTAAPVDTTAAAANANNANGNGANANANPDMAFATDAANTNAMEIQMLQAGVDKGTDKNLKSDAKKMLADHKKLSDEMGSWAKKKNMNLPPMAGNMDMSDMNGKTGKDWDKAWVDKMVDGHKSTIAKFEAAQNTVTDPDLKALITKTLPTLHSHLDMVTKLQSSMK